MDRKEEIYKMADTLYPEERKPIDAAYVTDRLECIISVAERLTTGNIAHHRPEIICLASNLLHKITEDVNKH